MSDWKLSGTENPRSGEVHTWITKDGQYADLEDVVSELIDQQRTIERLRAIVTELTKQLAARHRADLCDKQELLVEIDQLRATNHHLRGLLETAVDAWECGHWVDASERPGWNSLIGMQQLRLTKAWHDEAKQAGGDDG